ncbi:MAG: DUF3108 domain-containing protein [Mucilaginibacter polytrichastri]|nr:DUF3108 domain-containing protein [Mucilaginibacter polytrichastri]
MKRSGLILLGCMLGLHVLAQAPPKLKEPVFASGEELSYKLRYGFITAAEGKLQVLDSKTDFDGRPAFHLIANGKTAGTFNVFYHVRNRYESFIDKSTLLPYVYTEDIHEGNYTREDHVTFNQDAKKIASKRKGNFTFKNDILDLVSAYYYSRNLDVSRIKIGTKFSLQYFLVDDVTSLSITYLGKERVKTAMGTFNCLKFNPSIKPGRIFKENSKLYLWVTDDGNRIPVKAQVEIIVGKVTMELTETKRLKYPLSSKIN